MKKTSRPQNVQAEARAFVNERALRSKVEMSRARRFIHFWGLVWRSFERNRCPVRASALAYGTLLALIPMLAVAMSITSTFLKEEGEDRIDQFIERLVASMTPPGDIVTNSPASNQTPPGSFSTTSTEASGMASAAGVAQEAALATFAKTEGALKARRSVARRIHEFIQNTQSGALGVTGSILLIFAAISMLSRIEDTFNDIWGVTHGRNWLTRIVLYWGVLSLAPMLLVVAAGLASGPHLEGPRHWIEQLPWVANLGFEVLPIGVLCLTFAVFYLLMPNTKVDWRAALAGGLVGGVLFHVNNVVSVLYVSRVVSNSRIYGSLGMVPVFMIGLYLSWLILLFGAQVAYAWQNRAAYLEEKQVESVNQRGREFVALRLATCLGQRFERGEPPPTVAEMAEALQIPTRLAQQVLRTLCGARLVTETAGAEPGYLPARPLGTITCHDLLTALRSSQGQELETREEAARAEVYGEFQRILEAERQAAAAVTLLALVNRAQPRLLEEGEPRSL